MGLYNLNFQFNELSLKANNICIILWRCIVNMPPSENGLIKYFYANRKIKDNALNTVKLCPQLTGKMDSLWLKSKSRAKRPWQAEEWSSSPCPTKCCKTCFSASKSNNHFWKQQQLKTSQMITCRPPGAK